MPDWLEVVLRTLFGVLALFAMTRLLGKRQITQLSPFEYITGISIGNLAASISLDVEYAWYLGLIALSVWVLVSLGIEFLQMKSIKMRNLIDSTATVLIKEGKILEDNVKKERLTTTELMSKLRKKSVFKVADVEFAIIEPSGEINILLKREHQPLTAAHLGIKVGPEIEPQAVIEDGNIMDEPLATMGLSREWLYEELQKLGVTVENVFFGQVNGFGELYVDLYDDQLQVSESQQRATLFAQLKKIEADIELFGLTTKNAEAKQMYEQSSKQLQQMIEDLKPVLVRC
ncbi:DUF421 domain-containing protein [Paenibacillus cremeus]|uniref:DUF421 domain-containing protein n=1 Tax=Paenibacillus cremeus TaxID=2163881 RepID=A0A559KFN5_9BACL|nr:DUF421 domain-containing protein [Paenibacillus cremeus]TVY10929.1 DUF421 domain-containing protein [Paenibacillus cremeus]